MLPCLSHEDLGERAKFTFLFKLQEEKRWAHTFHKTICARERNLCLYLTFKRGKYWSMAFTRVFVSESQPTFLFNSPRDGRDNFMPFTRVFVRK